MPPRKRFIIALIIVVLAAAFCGSRVVLSQDHAKPRGGSAPEARQPRAGRSESRGDRDQGRARQGDSRARRPQPGARAEGDRSGERSRPPAYRPPSGRSQAERRHPQADGRSGRDYDNRYGRYHPRYYPRPYRYDRHRFPRYYGGLTLFFGLRYRGYPFGPHYGLWYDRDGYLSLFYWPFAYPPRGCGWYYVPTERIEYYDPWTGEWSYDYTDWDYVYICVD